MESIQMQAASVNSIRQKLGGMQEMFAGMKDMENMGIICIPVYASLREKSPCGTKMD